MVIKNWVLLSLLLIIAPMIIGTLWTHIIPMDGKVKYVLFCWLTGFLTVMAVSQIILVPLVLRRFTFAHYCNLVVAIYGLLLLVAIVFLYRRRGEIVHQWKTKEAGDAVPWNVWQILFLLGAVGLIFAQAFVTGYFQHIDDDDSRFVVEQVMAVEKGAMYTENPVTGKISYWDMGEVRKDMVSPWAMLVAFWCKLSGIAPAVLSHKYLPFFLTLLCYGVYALIGMQLLKKDREKVCTFLIFASALNIFGYFSTHTTQAVFLLRLWQGKALVGALMVPAMFYIIYECMNATKKKMWYFLGATGATAACLASGSGITIIPVVIGISGLAELIHSRKIKNAIGMWAMAVPSVVYLACYLFFWQLLKVYF